MPDKALGSALDDLHREVAEKSRQLSELDVMLADYHAERARLIRALRRLQSQLREAQERVRAVPDPEQSELNGGPS